MDWMKILNKGLEYGKKIIAVATIVVIVVWLFNRSGSADDLSLREDITSLTNQLDALSEQNRLTSELVGGLVDINTRLIDGVKELERENTRARTITIELGEDNAELQRRTRLIQDRTLESEFVTDDIKRLIRSVERDNNFTRTDEQ